MGSTVAIANFRTKVEAEIAGAMLKAAGIPYVLQSTEGMLHGPINPGASILVSDAVAEHAREVLAEPLGEDLPEDVV
jgi:hydrogenase maturation factor